MSGASAGASAILAGAADGSNGTGGGGKTVLESGIGSGGSTYSLLTTVSELGPPVISKLGSIMDDSDAGNVGSGNIGSGIVGSDTVGSDVVGSGIVGSGIVGSGIVGSGNTGSGGVSCDEGCDDEVFNDAAVRGLSLGEASSFDALCCPDSSDAIMAA